MCFSEGMPLTNTLCTVRKKIEKMGCKVRIKHVKISKIFEASGSKSALGSLNGMVFYYQDIDNG
jgi:hypothetical protein